MFWEIANLRSISRAATKMNISAPVVSQALSELEEMLNTTLEVRKPRHFELTHDGILLLEQAQTMYGAANNAVNLFSDKQAIESEFSVTLPSELCTLWLPEKLKSFRAQWPNIKVNVIAEDHIADLTKNNIDVAIRAAYKSNIESTSPLRVKLTLLGQHIAGYTMQDYLHQCPYIGHSRHQKEYTFQVKTPSGDYEEHTLTTELTASIGIARRDMVRQGLGITMLIDSGLAEGESLGWYQRLCRDYEFGYVDLKPIYRDTIPSIGARLFVEHLNDARIARYKGV